MLRVAGLRLPEFLCFSVNPLDHSVNGWRGDRPGGRDFSLVVTKSECSDEHTFARCEMGGKKLAGAETALKNRHFLFSVFFVRQRLNKAVDDAPYRFARIPCGSSCQISKRRSKCNTNGKSRLTILTEFFGIQAKSHPHCQRRFYHVPGNGSPRGQSRKLLDTGLNNSSRADYFKRIVRRSI